MNGWRFGEVSVQRVLEFEAFLLPPSELFPASTVEEIDEHRHWLEPHLLDPSSGGLHLAFHSFVIRTRKLVILVDTCGGNDKHRPQKARYHMNRYPYLARLASAGVRPEQVDYVLCTHLHADHVGWNTRLIDGRWVPTFPNAKYLFSRPEWEHWKELKHRQEYTEDPYVEDSVLPVFEAGQALLIEMDYAFNNEVFLVPTPGHTPGHVCVKIESRGKHALMSGDLMHHPIQCERPDWNSCFCVDAEKSLDTRGKFIERYSDSETLIMPAHFPTPTVGHIVSHRARWHFRFEGGN